METTFSVGPGLQATPFLPSSLSWSVVHVGVAERFRTSVALHQGFVSALGFTRQIRMWVLVTSAAAYLVPMIVLRAVFGVPDMREGRRPGEGPTVKSPVNDTGPESATLPWRSKALSSGKVPRQSSGKR
jgi:hypothetical protein